jgi:hypothetical protein
MKNTFKLLVSVSVFLAFCGPVFAFTSISAIPGDNATLSRASNYETQARADEAAISGCRTSARRNAHAKLAKKCVVLDRSRGPGYGALVCGDGGCAWRTGYESEQAAVDAAYNACSANYKNCQRTNIEAWEDFAGFPRVAVTQPQIQTPSSMSDIYRARWCAKQDAPPPECTQ